jgi:predicted lactoylglutathione lyase
MFQLTKAHFKTVTQEPIRSHVQGSTVLINLMTDYPICSSCDVLTMVNKIKKRWGGGFVM